MGGVLVQLDPLDRVLGPTSLAPDEMWRRWILSTAVQTFERGGCSVDSFAAAVVEELELVGTAEAFIERFRNFPRGLYPGAVEMVASLPPDVTTGVLSNTSAIHWDHQIDAEVIRGLCDRAYLSFELGLVKPHREIFEYRGRRPRPDKRSCAVHRRQPDQRRRRPCRWAPRSIGKGPRGSDPGPARFRTSPLTTNVRPV